MCLFPVRVRTRWSGLFPYFEWSQLWSAKVCTNVMPEEHSIAELLIIPSILLGPRLSDSYTGVRHVA